MNNNTHRQGGNMTKIFDNIGADIRTLPHPTEKTIIRDALAATKKEQKTSQKSSMLVQNTHFTS